MKIVRLPSRKTALILTLLVMLWLPISTVFAADQSNMYWSGTNNSFGAASMTYLTGPDTWVVTIQATSTTSPAAFLFRNSNLNFDNKWARGAAVSFNARTTWYKSGADGTYNQTNGKYYIFTIKDVATANDSEGYLFEMAGSPMSISSTTRTSTNVCPGQAQVVTANLSGTPPTGQTVWLRYSADNWGSSTITQMTGSGASRTATIPSSTNTTGTTVRYYTFTSGDLSSISASDADYATVSIDNNSGSNYSYTVASSWATTTGGNWNTAGTWVCGAVPADDQPVAIAHNVTLDKNANVGSLTINGSTMLTSESGAARTLTLKSGSTLQNNGTFAANDGTVAFAGSGTIAGSATTFNNVTIAGAVNFGSSVSTIAGTLTINSGGSASTNAPSYASGSTLKYNTGGSRDRSLEWSATSGAGYPANVQVSNNTTLNLKGATSATRSMSGNLTIDSGSTLTMNDMNSPDHLTVGGSVNIVGTLTLSTGTANVSLGGDWTRTGTFTPNGSIVEFNGATAAQTINGATTFDRLTINNSNGVSLNAAQMVNINLNLSSGRLTLGGHNLTLGTSAEAIAGTHDSNTMIVATGNGFLKRMSSGSGYNYTFPVGDANNYSPVTLNCGTSIASGNYAQVKLTASKHGSMAGTDYIKRYWTMESDDTAVSCSGTFQYVDGDVAGTEGNITPVKYSSSVWNQLSSPSTDTTNNKLTGSFTSFSDFSGGNWGTLAVDLAFFTAAATPAGVTLAWETASETDNAGFNVYRAESDAGPWARLNAALIPAAAPGSSGGHAYTWVDATAAANTRYVYRLESVALDGTAEILDTLGVTYRPAQRRWLPLAR